MTQTRGKQLIIHAEFGQQSLLQKRNYSFREKGYTNLLYKGILPSLTVVGRKNRCIPYIYWAAAIFIVVSNYSNLFLPFAFFLDCSHFTLGYELIVRPETAGFVKSIRNLFPLV